MGRDLHFRGGSFYRLDDRTGFATRAERTRKEWNGLIVGDRFWEERQPQDLVKGVPDFQSVPDPRPLPPAQFVGPTFISLTASYGPQATVLGVNTLKGVSVGVPVSVMLNDGTQLFTSVIAVGIGSITLKRGLPSGAASGNLVTIRTEDIEVL